MIKLFKFIIKSVDFIIQYAKIKKTAIIEWHFLEKVKKCC